MKSPDADAIYLPSIGSSYGPSTLGINILPRRKENSFDIAVSFSNDLSPKKSTTSILDKTVGSLAHKSPHTCYRKRLNSSIARPARALICP